MPPTVGEQPTAGARSALDGPAADASVLVTDLDLGPGPDGAAVAAEARRRRPGLRAVYATGNPDLLRAADLRSGDRVYAKPFDALALAAEVRAMVRGASSGTPGGTATGLGRG